MKLWFSVQVMVLGLLIVFVGLAILIGAIVLLSVILRRFQKPKVPAAPAAVQPAPAAQPAPAPAEDDLALVAVMMAAILAGERADGGKGLVVRSVRRLGASAWSVAGRREQLGI